MDKDGTVTPTDPSLVEIVQSLKDLKAVVFPYSPDGIGCFIITIVPQFEKFGIMPWGGRIEGMHLVSLRRKGSEFFDLFGPNKFHAQYIGEKLNLGETDAEHIAELFDQLRELNATI